MATLARAGAALRGLAVRRTNLAALATLALAGALLSACRANPLAPATPPQPATVTVHIQVDAATTDYTFPAGTTVREAIALAGITLRELDRLEPAPYTLIDPGTTIVITRVTETFESEHATIPYTSQIVKNEGLPAGERRLLQVGQNGSEEITFRTVFEDGVQISRSIVNRVLVVPAVPEIIMVGSQGAFTPVPVTGTLAYINGRNAWVMRSSSAQRQPLTTSGDLDGRVFELSPDGQWLLFTRAVTDPASPVFNTLWTIPAALTRTATITSTSRITATRPVTAVVPLEQMLPISNVLYAEWSPVEPGVVAYSTAEKIPRAPGWQANNDLWLLRWGVNRSRQTVYTPTQLLDSSSGGLYGWWGTGYAFAPDGRSIAYARTDSFGVVSFEVYAPEYSATVSVAPLITFTPFNTHSEWAWFPEARWSADGRFLYTVTHGAPIGLEAPEDSPAFDVIALEAASGRALTLIPRAGMFANPAPSPLRSSPAETGFRVAYLQADDPNASPFSPYRLAVMDRDGSNTRFVFPPEGQPGLAPNEAVAWSADGSLLAVTYLGNLWLVDPDTGVTQQLTGDGLSGYPRWRR